LGNDEADGEGVVGLKPWRQFMVEMQFQRAQEAWRELEARAAAILNTLFKETGGRYD
jgi:hypothetical protein